MTAQWIHNWRCKNKCHPQFLPKCDFVLSDESHLSIYLGDLVEEITGKFPSETNITLVRKNLVPLIERLEGYL